MAQPLFLRYEPFDDPRSIEIKAAPSQPVPFTLIGGAAMANPDDPTLGHLMRFIEEVAGSLP